jgi:predicted membrane protein (TIGR00267 family)
MDRIFPSGVKGTEGPLGFFGRIKRFFSEFPVYNRIAKIDKIARRYFLMNAFDGIMTMLGLLIGSLAAGSSEPGMIIKISLGTTIAMAVSGISGAYIAEHAERIRELKELENATMRRLKNTRIYRAFSTAEFIVAFVDGVSPIAATIIVLIPFFFSALPIKMMYALSIAISFAVLSVLGAFTAQISKEKLLPAVGKMLLAGIASAGLGYFILA